MATVIDAFLVTLGLDGSKFSSGVKEVEKEQSKLEGAQKKRDEAEKRRTVDRDKATRNSVDGYRKVRNEVLALAAIFTAGVGIKDFITNTINGAVNLGYLSANLSMSTERIKAFQLASEMAGGSQEGLVAQLKESVESIAELSTGGGPNAGVQAFFRWGGSSSDLKDGNTYLLARSKIINELFKADPGRAALIAKQMGISEDQFNFIKQGPDAIEALIKAQEKSAAISAADAAAADKLRKQFLQLRNELEITAMKVVLRLAPAFERLFARLEQGAAWIAAHQDDISRWIDQSVTAVVEFVRWADRAAESVGGWKNVLIGLLAIKVVGIIAGIVQLGGALLGVASAVTGIGTAASVALPLLAKLAVPVAAVAGAGAAGYAAGTAVYDNLLPESFKVGIGEFISRTLASFGNEQAAENIRVNTGRDDYKDVPRPGATVAPVKTAPVKPPPPMPQAQQRLGELEVKYGLPKGLLDTIWETESSRGKKMMSSAGAEGHFQFMPATAKEYGLKDPYDFNESSDAAARKLRDLLKQYGGDLAKASAAYNWGQGNLDKKGLTNAPKETRDYVAKVTSGVQAAAMPANRIPTQQRAAANNTSTSEVNIQNLNVQTQARDSDNIARSIKPAIEKFMYTNSANTGMVR